MWAIILQTEAHYGVSIALVDEATAKRALARLRDVSHQDGQTTGTVGKTNDYYVGAVITKVVDNAFGYDSGMRIEECEMMKQLTS